VTGDTRWSDLPLSGTFVEMLKRVVGLAGTTIVTGSGNTQTKDVHATVAPTHMLDGFGSFVSPPPTARPVPVDFSGSASADHPPGFYGPPESLLAVNTLAATDRLAPLDFSPLANASHEVYRTTEPLDLRGPILLATLALLLLDSLVVLFLGGSIARLIPRRSGATAGSILVVGAMLVTLISAKAQEETPNPNVPQSALETKLAYVVTGNADVDSVSKAGLAGLTLFLAQRTALEPGDPIGLDIAHDELAFYPLIYWPIAPGAPMPSDAALKRIDAYMKDGGTVLFDTRDAVVAPPEPGGETRSPGMLELRKILSSLDIPELEPVPRDHVLTKTFYLLRNFPGRFDTGQLWVEALPSEDSEEASGRPARGGDGVSSIIITSNDFAGAWATRSDGQPLLPMVEGEPRQRELAFRAGVNIVMYTLTGNYKADQVHVPALLERLGQ
jgi:NAD(P)-dependent dehydrogenase (short-subunit alcohol dehydrogenase family)